MLVNQISVFIENRQGRLAEVTKVLSSNGINISAMSLSDASDFGLLRLIVSSPENAKNILKENNFAVNTTEVIAVAITHEVGGVSGVLDILDKNDLSIQYMYAFTSSKNHEALVVLKIDTPYEAVEVLTENGVRVLPPNIVYSL